MYNEFTWCETATFDVPEIKYFYESVFGWNMDGENNDYCICHSDHKPAAGILEMPRKFQERAMPAFWLSFIKVESVKDTVAQAIKLGAKIEIRPTELEGWGEYALIRDLAGAGFMIYQGEELQTRSSLESHGCMVWNELHVSSVHTVKKFYERLFGWKIELKSQRDATYEVLSPKGETIASMIELDEDQAEGKQYWMVYFGVKDVESTISAVQKNQGLVLFDLNENGERMTMVQDPQGAVFCLQQINGLKSAS